MQVGGDGKVHLGLWWSGPGVPQEDGWLLDTADLLRGSWETPPHQPQTPTHRLSP